VDVSQVIEANVRLVVERLLGESSWRKPLTMGRLKIAGARYHLTSGEVAWLA
jgi:hypothetical protein